MRRHGSENPESSGRPVLTPSSELAFPTTLAPTFHAKAVRRKKTKRRSGAFLVDRDGIISFRPVVVKGFVAVGITAMLGVHLFLLNQISNSTATTTSTSEAAAIHSDARSQTPLKPISNRTSTAKNRVLTTLRPIDKEQYTIRINTWQRHEQLLASIDHHASCPGVAQIQVVWCEPEDPPEALLRLHPDKVVIERHEVNSLNERFNILATNTPTLGILSMDDDVLRPCEAIDSGFFQWLQSPWRMVGFDYRVHVVNDDGTWKYGYLSTTQKNNRYSMSLPRYAFMHRDYLDWYMEDLPRPIFDHVAESFNCEDIAMSFFISSYANGLPPLLANFWAIESQIKLYSPKKISGSKQHKSLRDDCVENFAQLLNLKQRLMTAPILYRNETMFYCGDRHRDPDNNKPLKSFPHGEAAATDRLKDLFHKLNQWRVLENLEVMERVTKLKMKASAKAKAQGLIEQTKEWEARFKTA